MECVVFSIDGSFAASVSIMGSDPKVRPGAVDVVRSVATASVCPCDYACMGNIYVTFDAFFIICISVQTLAGPGLSDHLHHRPSWHAEATRGILALAAQLSPWDDLLLWRLGSWSPATEDHLPQEPHTGGTPLWTDHHFVIAVLHGNASNLWLIVSSLTSVT